MSAKAQGIVDGINTVLHNWKDECKGEVHYKLLYDLIVAEIEKLKAQEDITSDYKQIQTLAGLFAVQDYVGNQLAVYPDTDEIVW